MAIKLENFVAESLTQIINGVKLAQEKVESTGAVISPRMRKTTDNNSVGEAEGFGGQPCYKVLFDVAVTVNEETGTSGGIGVAAGIFAVGSKGQSNDKFANTSRIQFSVPVVLPLKKYNKKD